MCRFYSGVRSHIFFARRPSRLTILISNSITTHYYKITVTIGASSAFSFSRRSFTLVHLTSCRPEAHYHCDVDFDPFTFMRENKKKYGSFLPYQPCLPDNQPNSVQPRIRSLYAGRLKVDRVAVAHCERYTYPFLQPTARSHPPLLSEFIARHPQHLAPNNAMDFLSDNGGIDYNDCYCKPVHPQPSIYEDDRLIMT